MAEIFVFGSNLLGIHKKGAALHALKNHGAILGKGFGIQGQSYAIPTKFNPYQSLDIITINKYVADFLDWALYTKCNTYNVTCIGCGLAGYDATQIAPLFRLALNDILLSNVKLPLEFIEVLSN